MTESRQSDIQWPGFVELLRVPDGMTPAGTREWVPLQRVQRIYYGSMWGRGSAPLVGLADR